MRQGPLVASAQKPAWREREVGGRRQGGKSGERCMTGVMILESDLEGAVKNVCFDVHIFFVGSAIAGPSPVHR